LQSAKRFPKHDPQAKTVVRMRFLMGLNIEAVSHVQGMPGNTVKADAPRSFAHGGRKGFLMLAIVHLILSALPDSYGPPIDLAGGLFRRKRRQALQRAR
jgi:hypothetical protein